MDAARTQKEGSMNSQKTFRWVFENGWCSYQHWLRPKIPSAICQQSHSLLSELSHSSRLVMSVGPFLQEFKFRVLLPLLFISVQASILNGIAELEGCCCSVMLNMVEPIPWEGFWNTVLCVTSRTVDKQVRLLVELSQWLRTDPWISGILS